jgi:uncharacterized RDD family membrane protein YckC
MARTDSLGRPLRRFAGFWVRAIAALIDGVIVQLIWVLILLPAWLMFDWRFYEMPEYTFLAFMGLTMVNWLYEAAMTSGSMQATIGKIAFGAVVTDAEGRKISFERATIRHFAKFVSTVPALLGFVIQPLTTRKQTLHDMLAGTLVMNRRYLLK